MGRYDYHKNVCCDIRTYIQNNEIEITPENVDEWREVLNDTLWIDDGVTGNGSGSYTCDTWIAEEYLCHNWELLREAMQEFEITKLGRADAADVTIRCYLLAGCINEVLDEILDEYDPEAVEAQP